MEFRYLGNGHYFPPVAPNGRVYAVPLGQESQVEVFCLTQVGIMGAGVRSHWSEIVGCYYDDELWEIIPRNYSGRGMRFRRGLSCIMVIAGNEALTTHIQGYPIPMCVMNRIAFEQQRGSEGKLVAVTTRYATRVPARPIPTKAYFMKVKPFTTNTDHS